MGTRPLRSGLPATGLLIAALVAAFVTTGCGSTDAERPPPCPRVSILGEAANLTHFAQGPGQDLTDVDYEAAVTDVRSECRALGEDQRAVVVALAPVISATRGPANTDRSARFEYFVSVTDGDRNILNVVRFPVSVAFTGNRTRVTVVDDDPPVTVDLPDRAGTSPAAYQIFVGLQLTPQELEYNRLRQGALR